MTANKRKFKSPFDMRIPSDSKVYISKRKTPPLKVTQVYDKGRARINNWKFHYGITPFDIEQMLTAQNGECAICDKLIDLGSCHIDHDHRYGRRWWAVRGLLCRSCNAGLGLFRDSSIILNRAIKYLN